MAGALSFLNHSMDGPVGHGAEVPVSPQDPLPVSVQNAAAGVFNPVGVRAQAPPTYSTTNAFSPTANGVWVSLQGSATKLITITRAVISGTKSAASFGQFSVLKTSALWGGTPSALNVYKMDSTIAAATAVPKLIAAPGAASTILGISYNNGIFFAPAGTAPYAIDYQPSNMGNPMVLRGPSEFAGLFGLTQDGVFTGMSVQVTLEWTEE